jgi:hypothetical protein
MHGSQLGTFILFRLFQYNPESRVRNSGEIRMRSLLTRHLLAALVLLTANCAAQQPAPDKANNSVLWTEPGDIRSRNLYWGPGGEKHQPVPPVEFVGEDLNGTNPKFDVRDSNDKKWRVKLGAEAQPEVAASRLLWAVGYPTNENYFVRQLQVRNMPARLHRGQKLVEGGGTVLNVRLQRHPEHEKKVGDWNWRHNPFYGTREFNGLRVMMALIRNWDLNDENNAVLEDDDGHEIYEVTDLGTAFGSAGKRYTSAESKGQLSEFRKGKFISTTKDDHVDFAFPAMPPLLLHLFEIRFYLKERGVSWIGKHIPRNDVKWIGSLLAQLSPDQIRDAFRAAGYSPQEVEGFTTVLISRIQQLNGS